MHNLVGLFVQNGELINGWGQRETRFIEKEIIQKEKKKRSLRSPITSVKSKVYRARPKNKNLNKIERIRRTGCREERVWKCRRVESEMKEHERRNKRSQGKEGNYSSDKQTRARTSEKKNDVVTESTCYFSKTSSFFSAEINLQF